MSEQSSDLVLRNDEGEEEDIASDTGEEYR